jgi:methane/ammonia monooxygenase subunit B
MINGITMVDKKLIVVGLGVIMALGSMGFNWVESVLPTAEAHGVQAQLQSRFVRIEDETFNRQSLQTGETLCLSGKFVSLVTRDMRAWNSIFSESTNAGNRWEILSRDPPGNVFDIAGNSVVPYEICAMALEPGVYHVHSQLNVASVGPGLGPGQTVVVDGEFIIKPIPYTNIAYQSIIIGVAYVVTFATRPWQVI